MSKVGPASSKNETSDPSTNTKRINKSREQRDSELKAPSEEAAPPCRAEQDEQVKPKELFSCMKSFLNTLNPETKRPNSSALYANVPLSVKGKLFICDWLQI